MSTTAVDGDSVTLSVTISHCLRSSVENVTVTYRNEPSFNYTVTVYPNNSDTVSITLSDLMASTNYNATVVVYYREIERISPFPHLSYSINFATAADLLCEFFI